MASDSIANESRVQAIVDTAALPIITINENGIICSVNQATTKMLGYRQDELIGENICLIVPEPHGKIHDTYIKSYLKTGVKKIIGKGRELEAQGKDGHRIPIHLSVSEFKEGSTRFFVGILNDLSEIKDSERKIEAIVETALNPIITIDYKGVIQTINSATSRLFGYENEEMIGKNIKILIPEPHKIRHDRYIKNYLNTGEKKIIGTGRELEAQLKDGSIIPIHLSVSEFSIGNEKFFVGFINDLSSSKQAELKTKAVIQSAIVPIITINNAGIIESINDATLRMFGYQESELVGSDVKILAPKPHQEEGDHYLSAYINIGNRKKMGTGRKLNAIKKNGSIFPVHISVSEFYVGKKRYFVAIINDLTAVKTAEEKLKKANLYLEEQAWMQKGQVNLYKILASDQSLASIIDSVITFLCDYIDVPVGLFYRYDPEQKVATLASGCRIPSDLKIVDFKHGEGVVGQVLITKKLEQHKITSEPRLRLQTGLVDLYLPYLYVFPVMRGEHIVGVIEFGCERELSTRDLAFIGNVVEPIALNILVRIKDETVKYLFEETRKQAIDLQMQQKDLKKVNYELQASEEELRSQKEELKSTNEELKARSFALENEKKRLSEKTSELEETQELLQKRAFEIEESSRYKSEFLANMSHELRTPLNSILMLSQSMAENRKGNLNERQVSNLETIYTAGTDLLNLINDILDLSKIESGKFEVSYNLFRLDRFFDNLSRLMSPLAKSKGLTFKILISENVPMTIESDNVRLEQVFKNLLSNAIKFTDKGSVMIQVDIDDNNDIKFMIKDTGIGIPKDHQKSVFQAFQQVDGKTTRKFGGTGLGLSITKKLVDLLCGSITLVSTLGEGSIFTVSIPAKKPSLKAIEKKKILSQKKNRTLPRVKEPKKLYAPEIKMKDDRYDLQLGDKVIIIVEDDPSIYEVLMEMCHDLGFKVVLASDGISGVRLSEELRPAGLLLDLSLPRMDGLEVIDVLKSSNLTQHIPILVISAREDEHRSLAKGAIGYLTKPIEKANLRKFLNYIDNLNPRKQRTLLVIEADQNQRRAMNELLGQQDLNIIEASSGSEGLTFLEKEVPHCIILDLILPDMDGLKFLDKSQLILQENFFPPIIVYTAMDLSDEVMDKLEKYSNSIIIKGVKSLERLFFETTISLHRVEKNLSRAQQRMLRDLRDPGRIIRGRTILIVDDDTRNRLSLSEVLEDTGVEIITAKNGKEAVEIVQEKEVAIDLVLMDMMMPVMDGYEATRLIKDHCRDLPVIALTAKAMKGEKKKCLSVGCDDYVSKPVNIDQLLSLLRIWLYKSA